MTVIQMMKTSIEESDVKSLSLIDFLQGNRLRFQKYGVSIEVEAAHQNQLEAVYIALRKVFPAGFEKLLDSGRAEYRFTLTSEQSAESELSNLHLNGEKLFEIAEWDLFVDLVSSRIRLTIAEFAVGKVFLHAGVVGWKGKAIIIPAKSFAGKTTLVAELVRRGADYYSDEYAVLDADGNVEPFPKWLSMRGIINDWTQLDQPVEEFGGRAATGTIPAALVLIAAYQKGAKNPKQWSPERLSSGSGLMEILPHTLAIRNKPEFVLEVLNKLLNRAIIVKTARGEAVEFAETLLSYFDSQKNDL